MIVDGSREEKVTHTCAKGDYVNCPACEKAHADPNAKWGDCRCPLCWECTHTERWN